MSDIDQIDNLNKDLKTAKNADFMNVYNKSYRLAAAVFIISNTITGDEELKTKIKNLCLELVSMSVSIKDINFSPAANFVTGLEKDCLELISLLKISSVAGLISKMNVDILKEEFQSFILEINSLSESFEKNKNVSVKDLFTKSVLPSLPKTATLEIQNKGTRLYKDENKNSNGHRRKDLRRNMILDFIKGHDAVNIKDIVPHIIGCSEKTIQREIINLMREGKIRRSGERRWSKYSFIPS